jgi:hypothetical protein
MFAIFGVEEEENAAIAAVGGEFLGAAGWEACQAPNCIAGTAVLQADQQLTYADLTEAEGSFGCFTAPYQSLSRIQRLDILLNPKQVMSRHHNLGTYSGVP